MKRLEGKVAIVTGAGQGIGRGISLAYGLEGAKVVAASRTTSSVEAVVRQIREEGGTALGVTCDVGHEEQIKAAVARTVQEFGTVDILVNNAQSFGTADAPQNIPTPSPLENLSDAEWEFTLRTGLWASFWAMRAVFPYMKEHGGKIINFGSMSGQRGERGTAPYNATKEAIRALTRTAAREWGKYKINVNVINPASLTRALEESQSKHPPKTSSALSIPLGRLGDPQKDIGAAAVFLASSESDYITGMTFMVDGGLLMGP
jgi:NAD(P)-dependent dehydrogenase (short-subunit alcohol dehydrogenase family)